MKELVSMKCLHLGRIKSLRRLRDEAITEDNKGRLKQIISELPHFRSLDIESGGWTDSVVTIRLDGGWEIVGRHRFTADAIRRAIVLACRMIYRKFIKFNVEDG